MTKPSSAGSYAGPDTFSDATMAAHAAQGTTFRSGVRPATPAECAAYYNTIGRLVDLKAKLPLVLERYTDDGIPQKSELTNDGLADVIESLMKALEARPLSKSHADRLVKALCSLIDRLPK